MSRIVATFATLFALLTPHESQALFHLAVIDEVKSGANGNPSVQYVEIRMLSGSQTLVAHTKLTVFKCSGDGGGSAVLIGDLPANVPNGGPNLRWIMASPSAAVFLAASGITPDFTWDATVIGSIPTACGMVCWGAPSSTVPPNPPIWDATNPANYTDCVAYGAYDGTPEPAGNPPAGATPGDPTFSLRRADDFMFSNNFTLDCPSPTNNANMMGNFGSCTPPTTTTTVATTTTTTTTSTTATTLAFGGDDPGCPPDSSGHLKCGDAIVKALSKMIGTVIKCHTKQADAAFKTSIGKPTTFDEEGCESTAKGKYDTAVGKVTGICTTDQQNGASMARDTMLSALDGSFNGGVYCEGSSPIDSGGDDSGNVPPSADSSKCEDTIGKDLAKLAAGVLRCHFKAADAAFKNKPFDEETCEMTDPTSHKGALDKYNQARDKLIGTAKCPDTCQNASAQDALATSMISTLEALNDEPYPCP